MKRSLVPLALAAILTLPACAGPQPDSAGVDDDPAAIITGEDIRNRLHFLASDALLGRDTPSPGLEAAAAYLASEHRRMGLEPGANGSYFQRWPYRPDGGDEEEGPRDGDPANVVAIIPGSDPELREEFVVLTAHYDHVGTGNPVEGDSIFNGADDNGSGTSVLLETARAITSMDRAPRRSVAFVHVSGEEKGLLGSRWFVENPPEEIPVERMVANINSDMVAGDQHRDTLVVIGKEYSSLGPLVDGVNESLPELGLITSDDIWPEQRFFFRSDQLHFMRMEIPSLFFFTGVHECYHRPCDEIDFVDTEKAARVARLLVHSVLEIANADARPEWDPEGLAEVRELTGGS